MSHDNHFMKVQVGLLLIFTLIFVYIFIETMKDKKGIAFGHQASFVTLVGFFISLIFAVQDSDALQSVLEFNQDIFFYVCLPPLVFCSGFNMSRKKFFQNITNILICGVFGTCTTFFVFSALTLWLNGSGYLTQYSGTTGEESPLVFSTMEVLLMCSLLCSTDVIAAISMVNSETSPKLYSLLFGEGVVNDAVSIILFNSVLKFAAEPFSASTPFLIIGDFLMLAFFSLLIGFVFGLLCAFFLKVQRAFTKHAVNECVIIFCFSYCSYVVAEMFHQSGIITLLSVGITQAHYTWYNLSPQGKNGTALTFQFLGSAMEGFIFSYLGLTFFAYQEYNWSPRLIGIEFIIVIFGRFCGVLGLIKLLELCTYKSGVHWQELFFMSFAGVIRGAIAFGLVLRISYDDAPNRDVIVSTVITIVVITTVLFGSFVGLLTDWAVSAGGEAANVTDNDDFVRLDDVSHHSNLVHPNQEEDSDHQSDNRFEEEVKNMGCLQRCFFKMDRYYLKPWFVHKYSAEKLRQDDEFYEVQAKDGKNLQKIYKAVDDAISDTASNKALSQHSSKSQDRKSKLSAMAEFATSTRTPQGNVQKSSSQENKEQLPAFGTVNESTHDDA